MASGPVCAMVWEGLNVVKTGRVMLGETNPKDSAPGTIRGDFCIQVNKRQLLTVICSIVRAVNWNASIARFEFRGNVLFKSYCKFVPLLWLRTVIVLLKASV